MKKLILRDMIANKHAMALHAAYAQIGSRQFYANIGTKGSL